MSAVCGHRLPRKAAGSAGKPRFDATSRALRTRVGGNASAQHKHHISRVSLSLSAGSDKIDPKTGLLLESEDVVRNEVEINSTTWSYRETPKNADKPTVVLLHGVLSSSYSYRRVVDILGGEGYHVIAPDWPGHGESSAPAAGKFAYKSEDYVHSLSAFLYKIGVKEPFVLVTQGFILGQYGLLYALKNADMIEKLVVFNTPLERKTKLPAALKKLGGSDGGLFGGFANPFAQKDAGGEVEAAAYMQGGSPYLMDRDDGEAYQTPFADQENQNAARQLMENVDYEKVVETIDVGFQSWRKDTLVAFGTSDYYIDWNTAGEWLEDKRTCIRFYTFTDKMGHTVQDDYPERVAEVTKNFIEGKEIQRKGDLKRTGDQT